METPKKGENNKNPITPRRSTRLQTKMKEKTPEPSSASHNKPARGPRAMMKLSRSKQNLDESSDLNATQNKSTLAVAKLTDIPEIFVTSPSRHGDQIEKDLDQTWKDTVEVAKIDTVEVTKAKHVADKVEKVMEEKPAEVTTNDNTSQTMGESTIDNTQSKGEITVIHNVPSVTHQTYAEVVSHDPSPLASADNDENKIEKNDGDNGFMNVTPQLIDESIISVPDTPAVNITAPQKDATFSPEVDKSINDSRPVIEEASTNVKDSTFSPVVDKSIHDSRPHIEDDIESVFNTTPMYRTNKLPHRTSTPLAQKLMKRETPKPGTPAMSALAKMLSPKATSKEKLLETMNDTLNGQFKMVNPLEKSILKSSRKRSLSVADAESLVSKKVMFISPKIMDIGEIDEKMMQSYREEKENSIMMKAQVASGGNRRKRSMSATETPTKLAKAKTPQRKVMPDFKKIHEDRFNKMESIDEHAQRKAVRAKKLIAQTKSMPMGVPLAESSVLPSVSENPPQQKSKIPTVTRKPLSKLPQLTTASASQPIIEAQRPLKRSMSADIQPFSVVQAKKVGVVTALPRAMSQDKAKVKFPLLKAASTTAIGKPSTSHVRSKVEDRREKNMSLYKSSVTTSRGNSADVRKKNENMLKGVRLNRRFELQMQHRMAGDHNDD